MHRSSHQSMGFQPAKPVRSMDELMAIAFAMEKESADRYGALARRMRAAGREDLAAVFDRLVGEEASQLDRLVAWSLETLRHAPAARRQAPRGVFDDEGAALVAPELQDAYHALAMAVRNDDRAFAFWAYVAADAPTPAIREAAERMARAKLEHVKILRRERRRAFVADRSRKLAAAGTRDLAAAERDVAIGLAALAEAGEGSLAQEGRALAAEARALADALEAEPLDETAPVGVPSAASLEVLCEWLAEHYLEAGETLASQPGRDRAQALAGMAIRRLALIRHLEAARG